MIETWVNPRVLRDKGSSAVRIILAMVWRTAKAAAEMGAECCKTVAFGVLGEMEGLSVQAGAVFWHLTCRVEPPAVLAGVRRDFQPQNGGRWNDEKLLRDNDQGLWGCGQTKHVLRAISPMFGSRTYSSVLRNWYSSGSGTWRHVGPATNQRIDGI